MQENIKKYHPLGAKTLFMFIFKRSLILLLLLPILLFGLVFLVYVPSEYFNTTATIVWAYFVFLLVFVMLVFFVGWLQYFRYWIFVDDKDLKIAKGLIATEQIGIPYRRIKDLKIERSLLDQIVGVSDIIITVLGEEEEKNGQEMSTIILPDIAKEIALEIQDIVLRKAQVEQISVLNAQKIA